MSREMRRVLHPGYQIKEYIEDVEMTQDEFAKRLGITGKQLSLLLSYQASITPDIAYKLSAMIGNSIEFWLNLQSNYDAYIVKLNSIEEIEKEKMIYSMIDKKFLKKLNIIDSSDNIDSGIYKIRRAALVSNLSMLTKNDIYSFCRTSTCRDEEPKNIVCRNLWISLAYRIAQQEEVQEFNEDLIIKKIPYFRSLTLENAEIIYPILKKELSECGVSLVILPALKNSNINGAIKWIDEKRVMMALNNRGKDQDKFWFSFFHELKHVLQKVKRKIIIGEDKNKINDEYELDVDNFARETLIPSLEYESFDDYSENGILKFAKKIKIHPGIVVGRLQNDGKIPHDRFNGLKAKYEIAMLND